MFISISISKSMFQVLFLIKISMLQTTFTNVINLVQLLFNTSEMVCHLFTYVVLINHYFWYFPFQISMNV